MNTKLYNDYKDAVATMVAAKEALALSPEAQALEAAKKAYANSAASKAYDAALDGWKAAGQKMTTDLIGALKGMKGWCPSAEATRVGYIAEHTAKGYFSKPGWVASFVMELIDHEERGKVQQAINAALKGVNGGKIQHLVLVGKAREFNGLGFAPKMGGRSFEISVTYNGGEIARVKEDGSLAQKDGITVESAELLANFCA